MSYQSDQYIKRHRWSGLKVGDKVRVLRTARIWEAGWNNTWVDSMDFKEGQVLTIDDDRNEEGFHMASGYSYPCFVLQKVEDTEANDGRDVD